MSTFAKIATRNLSRCAQLKMPIRRSLVIIAKAKKPIGSCLCFSPKAAARSLPVQAVAVVPAQEEVVALAHIELIDHCKEGGKLSDGNSDKARTHP